MKYLACLIFTVVSFTGLVAQTISVETKQGKSGNAYTFIKKNTCTIAFTDKRPDATDKTVLAIIPAAFTNLENYKIDGIYAVNGKVENTSVKYVAWRCILY